MTLAERSRGKSVIMNNGSGGRKASEPPGEGDGRFDVIVNVDNDVDGGGGGQYVALLLFC